MYSILYKHKLLNTEVLLETSLRSVDHRDWEGVCYMRGRGGMMEVIKTRGAREELLM